MIVEECLNLQNTPMDVFGEVWYNDIWLQGPQLRMTYDCVIEKNESLGKIIGFRVVLDLFRDTVRIDAMRVDEIGAKFHFLRIIGNVAEEDMDGKAAIEIVYPAVNLGGPFVVSTIIRGSGRTSGDSRISHNYLRGGRGVGHAVSRCGVWVWTDD